MNDYVKEGEVNGLSATIHASMDMNMATLR